MSFETFTGSVEHTGPEKFPRKATCVWAFFFPKIPETTWTPKCYGIKVFHFLQSDSLSGMCTKLHTVAASNNRIHLTRSLYYCLFMPHLYMSIVLCAHSVCDEPRIQRNTSGEVATHCSFYGEEQG